MPGMLLSDLGAEVVKVEMPEGGDPFRMWGKTDYNGTFGSMNRNKKSVTLDLRTEVGKAGARKLALGADVIIENMRAGAMERFGLGYEALATDNPRLVYCSITGFGSEGPYRDRPGYDTVGQAVSGLLSVLTDRKAPQPMGVSLSDHLAGAFAAYGVLAALMARTATGCGQKVETSLLQATLSFLGENAATFFEDGKVPSRRTRCQRAQVFTFTATAMACHSPCTYRRLRNSGEASWWRLIVRPWLPMNDSALGSSASRTTTPCAPNSPQCSSRGRVLNGSSSLGRKTCQAVRSIPSRRSLPILRSSRSICARTCRITAAAPSPSSVIRCGSVRRRPGSRPPRRIWGRTTTCSCAEMTCRMLESDEAGTSNFG